MKRRNFLKLVAGAVMAPSALLKGGVISKAIPYGIPYWVGVDSAISGGDQTAVAIVGERSKRVWIIDEYIEADKVSARAIEFSVEDPLTGGLVLIHRVEFADNASLFL